MIKRIIRFFEDTIDDLGYSLARAGAYITGKSGAGLLAGIAIGALSGFGVTGDTAFIAQTTLAVAGVAGISGYLVQQDFLHNRRNLVERYREEVGSLLGKAPDKVQEADIELMARGDFKKGIPANPAIRRELKNTWLNRNVGVFLSAAVSALTYAAVHALDHYYGANIGGSLEELLHEHGFIEAATKHSGEFFSTLARNGLIGLVTYHTLKTPAHWALSEILDIDERTVNDRITEIKRTLGHGREVKPEQILGIAIHAQTDIREQIEAEYGKPYDKMSRKQQQELVRIADQFGMNVIPMAHYISSGMERPEKMAFWVYGQSSGLGVAEEGSHIHKGNVLDGMWRGLKAITGDYSKPVDSRTQMAQVSGNIASDMSGQTTLTVNTPDEDHAAMHLENEYEEPGRKQSFAARVARSMDHSADGRSHVERLEQSSSKQTILTPTVS